MDTLVDTNGNPLEENRNYRIQYIRQTGQNDDQYESMVEATGANGSIATVLRVEFDPIRAKREAWSKNTITGRTRWMDNNYTFTPETGGTRKNRRRRKTKLIRKR